MTSTLFYPPGASHFNRFVTGDTENALIGGLLVLLIMLLLEDIVRLILFPSNALDKHAVDRYIIFSRLSSMRGLTRLFAGREWPAHLISEDEERTCFGSKSHLAVTDSVNQESHVEESYDLSSIRMPAVPAVKRKFSRLLLPAMTRIFLLIIEFCAIYAGTNSLHDVLAENGYDCRLAQSSASTAGTSLAANSSCDNFLGPARGENGAGELLRCVSTFSKSAPPHRTDGNTSAALVFDPKRNQLVLQIDYSLEANIRHVRVQVMINSLSRDVLHLAPLRPDVQFEHSVQVFKSVVRAALKKLDVAFEGTLTLFPGGGETRAFDQYGKVYMVYSQQLAKEASQDVLADVLTEQLRALPLERNSSGAPWVHGNRTGYIRNGSAVIATIGLNRIAHGTLLIMVVVLWVVRIVMTNWVGVGFEEAGYLVSQKVLDEDLDDNTIQHSRAPKSHAAELRLRRFAHGRTGHFGYTRTDERQLVVASFEGCEEVI